MVNDVTAGIKQLAKANQALQKAAFESRFDTIQRGLLTQLNKEIEKVQENGAEREIETLQKKRDNLFKRIDDLKQVQFDLQSNSYRLLEVHEDASDAVTAANADGNDTLSEDEATALNTAKDELIAKLRKLHSFGSETGITDGFIANRFRAYAETLEGLTATSGAIDPEGTTPATNQNRELIDALTTLSTNAANDAESTSYLFAQTGRLIVDTQKAAYDKEADLAELTATRLAQKQEEIENLEIRYTNLIRSISLAFEVQSGITDALVTGTEFKPEKGSILNLFT